MCHFVTPTYRYLIVNKILSTTLCVEQYMKSNKIIISMI